MVVWSSVLIFAGVIFGVWILLKLKEMRHKVTSIIIIFLLAFLYFSFSYVVNHSNVDLKSVSGIIDAINLYFSWLFSVFNNFKILTSNAIKMNWAGNFSR